MEATELVMQCARANPKNNTNTSQSCFLKYGNMEQHPPIMCKANSKLKWACLIKHLADAELPNARIQMQGSVPKQRFIPICLCWKALEISLKTAILRCNPKSEVV